MNPPPLLSSWDWLLKPEYRDTIMMDFRPGWDSLAHLEQLISREEFEERLGRCETSLKTGSLRERVRKTEVV